MLPAFGISRSSLECEYTKIDWISLDSYIIILPLPNVYYVINLKAFNFSLIDLNMHNAVVSTKGEMRCVTWELENKGNLWQ